MIHTYGTSYVSQVVCVNRACVCLVLYISYTHMICICVWYIYHTHICQQIWWDNRPAPGDTVIYVMHHVVICVWWDMCVLRHVCDDWRVCDDWHMWLHSWHLWLYHQAQVCCLIISSYHTHICHRMWWVQALNYMIWPASGDTVIYVMNHAVIVLRYMRRMAMDKTLETTDREREHIERENIYLETRDI